MEVSQYENADISATRGEQQDLADWINPDVPEAVHGVHPEDADGWSTIDSLSAWECGLCQFKTLEEVPTVFRHKWTKAMSTILTRILAAQSVEETNRGLKWFLATAQVFFREPKRGGKKGQSNSKIAFRFNCLSRGDWGSLLVQLETDKAAAARRQPATTEGTRKHQN